MRDHLGLLSSEEGKVANGRRERERREIEREKENATQQRRDRERKMWGERGIGIERGIKREREASSPSLLPSTSLTLTICQTHMTVAVSRVTNNDVGGSNFGM